MRWIYQVFPMASGRAGAVSGWCLQRSTHSVLCTELTPLGPAPAPRGFLTDVTAVPRVPLCAPFPPSCHRLKLLPVLILPAFPGGSHAAHTPGTAQHLPWAGSAAGAGERWQRRGCCGIPRGRGRKRLRVRAPAGCAERLRGAVTELLFPREDSPPRPGWDLSCPA